MADLGAASGGRPHFRGALPGQHQDSQRNPRVWARDAPSSAMATRGDAALHGAPPLRAAYRGGASPAAYRHDSAAWRQQQQEEEEVAGAPPLRRAGRGLRTDQLDRFMDVGLYQAEPHGRRQRLPSHAAVGGGGFVPAAAAAAADKGGGGRLRHQSQQPDDTAAYATPSRDGGRAVAWQSVSNDRFGAAAAAAAAYYDDDYMGRGRHAPAGLLAARSYDRMVRRLSAQLASVGGAAGEGVLYSPRVQQQPPLHTGSSRRPASVTPHRLLEPPAAADTYGNEAARPYMASSAGAAARPSGAFPRRPVFQGDSSSSSSGRNHLLQPDPHAADHRKQHQWQFVDNYDNRYGSEDAGDGGRRHQQTLLSPGAAAAGGKVNANGASRYPTSYSAAPAASHNFRSTIPSAETALLGPSRSGASAAAAGNHSRAPAAGVATAPQELLQTVYAPAAPLTAESAFTAAPAAFDSLSSDSDDDPFSAAHRLRRARAPEASNGAAVAQMQHQPWHHQTVRSSSGGVINNHVRERVPVSDQPQQALLPPPPGSSTKPAVGAAGARGGGTRLQWHDYCPPTIQHGVNLLGSVRVSHVGGVGRSVASQRGAVFHELKWLDVDVGRRLHLIAPSLSVWSTEVEGVFKVSTHCHGEVECGQPWRLVDSAALLCSCGGRPRFGPELCAHLYAVCLHQAGCLGDGGGGGSGVSTLYAAHNSPLRLKVGLLLKAKETVLQVAEGGRPAEPLLRQLAAGFQQQVIRSCPDSRARQLRLACAAGAEAVAAVLLQSVVKRSEPRAYFWRDMARVSGMIRQLQTDSTVSADQWSGLCGLVGRVSCRQPLTRLPAAHIQSFG